MARYIRFHQLFAAKTSPLYPLRYDTGLSPLPKMAPKRKAPAKKSEEAEPVAAAPKKTKTTKTSTAADGAVTIEACKS